MNRFFALPWILVLLALGSLGCPFPPGPTPSPLQSGEEKDAKAQASATTKAASQPSSPPSPRLSPSPSALSSTSSPADLRPSSSRPASLRPSSAASMPSSEDPNLVFGPKTPEEARWQAQILPLLHQTFRRLLTRLMQAIRQDGIPGGLTTCSQIALPLTASIGKRKGLKISRVSHRPRNPLNSASPLERRLIEAYAQRLRSKLPLLPVFLASPQGQKRMYSPILLPLPTCLQCHGRPQSDIQPAHLSLIQKLYPHDQATGFSLGDLRGLWKVEW